MISASAAADITRANFCNDPVMNRVLARIISLASSGFHSCSISVEELGLKKKSVKEEIETLSLKLHKEGYKSKFTEGTLQVSWN